MSFSLLIRYFKILIFSKKKYYFPKRSKVIILDAMGKKKIESTLLHNINYETLHLRGESINLPILFLSFINMFFYGRDSYVITYIKYVQPKIAITFIDTSFQFCRFMSKIKQCKFIIIQNGRRQGNEILTFVNKNINYELKADYYFVFNSSYAKYIKKYIKADCIVGGSILNNQFNPITKIQYISDFHNPEMVSKTIDYHAWEIQPTEFILKILSKFCREKKLELEILGRTEYYLEEINFYKKFNLPFSFIKKKIENYSFLSSEAIVVGMSSTLIYESFSRMFRTAFFDIRNSFYLLNKLKPGFAFPDKTENFGKFWSNIPKEEKMYENLKFLYSVSESDWSDIVKNWSKFLMVHNHNNLIYKQILKKEGLYNF